MLGTIVVVLVTLWLLGFVSGYTTGDFTHILLAVAIIAMLIKVEDECSEYGAGHARQRYLKRQLLGRSGKILPTLALLSGEKVPQPIVAPQTCRE